MDKYHSECFTGCLYSSKHTEHIPVVHTQFLISYVGPVGLPLFHEGRHALFPVRSREGGVEQPLLGGEALCVKSGMFFVATSQTICRSP